MADEPNKPAEGLNEEVIEALVVKGEGVDQSFDLKVDGKTITMTLDEMKANAQKGLSAAQRFEAAATSKKEAEQLQQEAAVAINVLKDLKRVSEENDLDAQIRVWDAIGVPKDEQERTLKEVYGVDAGTPTTPEGAPPVEDTRISEELNQIKSQLEYQRQLRVSEMNQELLDRVEKNLDNDEKFQEMLKSVDEDVRSARRELAVEVATESALSQLRTKREMGQSYDTSWLRTAAEEGVKSVVPTLQKLGLNAPTHHGRAASISGVGAVGPVEPPKAPPSDAGIKDLTKWSEKLILAEIANQRSQGK
jgi:hypothetical protein